MSILVLFRVKDLGKKWPVAECLGLPGGWVAIVAHVALTLHSWLTSSTHHTSKYGLLHFQNRPGSSRWRWRCNSSPGFRAGFSQTNGWLRPSLYTAGGLGDAWMPIWTQIFFIFPSSLWISVSRIEFLRTSSNMVQKRWSKQMILPVKKQNQTQNVAQLTRVI